MTTAYNPTPLEQQAPTATAKRKISIGVPAAAAPGERRFPLTPEGAQILVERGFDVIIETAAANVIHFSDDSYRRAGCKICSRAEALACDIVLHLPAITADDAARLKSGAVLLSLLHLGQQNRDAINTLLKRHIIAIALDLITDDNDNRPFADILSEIDGRAAIAIASSLLADAVHGKGILLGGIAGIVPCEVTIIGSGIAAQAAALSATGLGATVRMFDNDVYRLRDALHRLDDRAVIGSSIHPKVFNAALRSADIVIATPTRHPVTIGADTVADMKRGVITFDLTGNHNRPVFPTLTHIDLAMARPEDTTPSTCVRSTYINAGSAVPRTAAMALSTTLLTLLDDITIFDCIPNALKFNAGLSRAAYTFLGKLVNEKIGKALNIRSVDISLFLQFS